MKSYKDLEIRNIFEDNYFSEISSVFILPKHQWILKKGNIFENFYDIEFENNGEIYCLRSFSKNFCITPVDMLKEKFSALYSSGKGLYRGEEKNIILAEMFSNDIKTITFAKEKLLMEFKKIENLAFQIKIKERFDKYWLNISVMKI